MEKLVFVYQIVFCRRRNFIKILCRFVVSDKYLEKLKRVEKEGYGKTFL